MKLGTAFALTASVALNVALIAWINPLDAPPITLSSITGPECLLTRSPAGGNTDSLWQETFMLVCPDGLGVGPNWDEAVASYLTKTDGIRIERVYKPKGVPDAYRPRSH